MEKYKKMIVENFNDLELLTAYSALEQFSDATVFHTSFPIKDTELDLSFFGKVDMHYINPFQEDYEILLNNLALFLKCNIQSKISLPSAVTCPLPMTEDGYQMLIELNKNLLLIIDNFFKNTDVCLFENEQLVPKELTEFLEIEKGRSVYHFIVEREEVAREVLKNCIYEYQLSAPYAAESLFYRVDKTNPSFDELWFYILEGLKEEHTRAFYALITSDFIEKMDKFQTDFIKKSGWRFDEEFFGIYELALEKKETWCIPFNLAFALAIKDVMNSTIFGYLAGVNAPKITNLESEEACAAFIEYFNFNTISFLYFIVRNDLQEKIAVLEYYKQNYDLEENYLDRWFIPQCCLFKAAADKSYMNPSILSGHLYCAYTLDSFNTNFTANRAILDEWFDDLCKMELIRQSPVNIVFFSMGRLYLFTLLSAVLFLLLYGVFCFKMYIVFPNMYQFFFESLYSFVFNIVADQAGILAIVHFPLVFTIFNVILYGNIIGLIPYGFTITSHLTFTFSLGLFVFIGIVLLTILNKRLDFIKLFVPTGVPKMLVPLLCVIEVISYIFRVVSLSVRLFANMMAGHALLHILLGFVPVIFNFKNIVRFLFLFPIVIIILITLLEVGISLLQSYVFIVLISIYLRDCYGESSH